MKKVTLTLMAFATLAVAVSAARAVPFDFTYTGSLVSFTVPATGPYQILAYGAQGGNGVAPGGLGAEIGGDFSLTAAEVLEIAVGGAGGLSGGGGGGSFVVGPGNTPLVIAGAGGGGASGGSIGNFPGQGGLTGSGNGEGGACGTEAGFPQAILSGGGGGFLSAGGCSIAGRGYPDLAGGGNGGFGGGGAGGPSGGGGGGYSGGNGGIKSIGGAAGGGGGGSFDAGIDEVLVADFRSGNGEVEITPVFAGLPGKANCGGQSDSGLAKQYGGLNGAAAALGYSSVEALQDAISGYCVEGPLLASLTGDPDPVTEPSSIALLGAGLIGLIVVSRRRLNGLD